jgi:hypothetical protein
MRFGTFSYNQARPWVAEHQAFEELLAQIELTEQLWATTMRGLPNIITLITACLHRRI